MDRKDFLKIIKDSLKEETSVIGYELTIKNLKLGRMEKVFVTSSLPGNMISEIEHYSRMAETEVIKLDIPSDELGIICKKSYPISVFSIKKV